MLTITMDWLALTFKEITDESANFIALRANFGTPVSETPRHGYNTTIRDENDVLSAWNTLRDEMGTHVVFSGRALQKVLSEYNITQQALLQEALDSGARIVRLDLAKDALDEPCDITQIYRYIEGKQYTGTARTFGEIKSSGGGHTVYIGSRTSEKFVRLYDKAAQLGKLGVHWYRLELEAKGATARALASFMARDGDWASAFDKLLYSTIDIPSCPSWEIFRSKDTIAVGIPKEEKLTDREKWILQQCLPAIVKHYVEHRYSKAVALLRETLDLIDRDGYPSQDETN